MHVGGIVIFEGPAPSYEEISEHLLARLSFVPRYRQKLAFAPLESGRPIWIDDTRFNLERHLRHTALPAPGSETQLQALAGRIFGQPLDRHRPLWEIWLVHGLSGNRFALISKSHHALVDGVSGVDLISVLFDFERSPANNNGHIEEFEPSPPPSQLELGIKAAIDMIEGPIELAEHAVGVVLNPTAGLRKVSDALSGVADIFWELLNPAPETPLNVEIGPDRRVAISRQKLSDFKEIKNKLGGTINDVVLTVTTGALRRWLVRRDISRSGLSLRALVPVSIRAEHEHGELGNRIAAMRATLPVHCDDAATCLRLVSAEMDGLKESKQAVGAEVLINMQNFAPPTVLAQASRLAFSTRLFNLIVTNVPGPQFPLFVLGRQLLDIFPIAFLPKKHALAVAVMSYNGSINFGLLGDYDELPDLDLLAEDVDGAVSELLAVARSYPATPTPKRKQKRESVMK